MRLGSFTCPGCGWTRDLIDSADAVEHMKHQCPARSRKKIHDAGVAEAISEIEQRRRDRPPPTDDDLRKCAVCGEREGTTMIDARLICARCAKKVSKAA